MESKEIAEKLMGNIENYRKDFDGLAEAAANVYKRAIIDTKQLCGEITDEDKLFKTLAEIGDKVYQSDNKLFEAFDYPVFYLFFKTVARAFLARKYGEAWFQKFMDEVNRS